MCAHYCVCCENAFDESEMVRITKANRASHNNAGTGFICRNCADDTAPRKARNKTERGAETLAALEYRFTLPCEYTAQARAEFCGRNGWLACKGAIKSPKLANMKWQRRLETLDALIQRGELAFTSDVYVSVIYDGRVLECVECTYENKDDFLLFVRALVDGYKKAAYTIKCGKPFHYGKTYESYFGEPCDWQVFAKRMGLI